MMTIEEFIERDEGRRLAETFRLVRVGMERKLLHLDTIFIPTIVVLNMFWTKLGQVWGTNAVISAEGIQVSVNRN